jgi:hypothetical protein
MAEYADLAQINTLYQQAEQVTAAINNLDRGGEPTNITIGPPPPPDPDQITNGFIYAMASSVGIVGPCTPELLTQVRATLVDRGNQIAAELEALGVTSAPIRS